MKKFLDGPTSVEELRRVVMELREREDKKTFFTIMAIVIALLVATTAGVMYLVKRKKDNDFDYEDWDDQWDDEFEYDDEIEELGDLVESKIVQGIQEGNTTLAIFYAKTKLKHRGYIECQEVASTQPIVIRIDEDDARL